MQAPTLREYQRRAAAFLQENKRAAAFAEMGAGKSAIALSALTPEMLPALIVAPKRVAEHVWPVEAQMWRPDLRVTLAAGKPERRRKALEMTAEGCHDVAVIGVDNLADAVAYRWRTLIIDESSMMKNHGTARSRNARKIAKTAENVYLLSGTPSPNSLLDLWPQIKLLDDGERLGKRLGGYRERYFSPGRTLSTGVVTEWIPKPGANEAIHRRIDDICFSLRTEDLVEMPPVTHNTIRTPMPAKVEKVYKSMKRDLVAALDILGSDAIASAGNAAIASSKLSQIAAGFVYEDDGNGLYEWLHDEKVNALRDIIEQASSPVLVFYRYRAEIHSIMREFPQAVAIDAPGAIERWNRGEVPVMVAHPASAGHGLNLQHGGHTMVWTSAPWSLEQWEQANARLARPGQTSPVIIHTLVTPGTVDEAVTARLQDKASVQDALLAHLNLGA